jgi:uncharacterized protein YbjT (DUF2867 family)
MNVLIFGATGMVGQGVLRECLRDPEVEQAVTIGRTPTRNRDGKLREIVHSDLSNYAAIEPELAGFDACFFCLGVSSNRMSEVDYSQLTYDLTLSAAQALSRVNPSMTFIYVSGAGTDSTEKGRTMWARVKGRTENALLKLPLNAYMFRPGFIQPMDGIHSKTPSYRVFYKVLGPLLPILRWAFPNQVLTTREIGQAMLGVARSAFWRQRIFELW